MKSTLLLLLAALFTGCAAVPDKAAAPDKAAQAQLVDWQYGGTRSFEKDDPGLGVSHRYQSKAGWIDVYVYGLQRSSWAAGVSDPQFQSHFQSTVEEVKEAVRKGNYADLKLGSERDVKIGGADFRTVRYTYMVSGKPVESHTFLSGVNGKLLKYRMSFYAPVPADLNSVLYRFIEEDMRAGSIPRRGKFVELHGHPVTIALFSESTQLN
jgi:hypothetical protein